jgi:hypothetical protein
MKPWKIALIGVASAGALMPVATAHASFGMPRLLTVSPREQADEVSNAALSGDGRYLVFAGSLDGRSGILRRDLQTDVVEPVAVADAYGDSPLRDAAFPAISASGRSVSFTTSAALDPADDHNQQADVYVRDMTIPVPGDGAACAVDGPCGYTLVSALDGTTTGLTYQAGGGSGSTAAARQAISADGRRVAFIVVAESDLAGPGTPAGQVAVRDLETRRTTLVSTLRDPDTGSMTDRPVPGRAVVGQGAALSADGTTVAWIGERIGQQAATVGDDPGGALGDYNEPLWRRIADGPAAPIRRVAGAGDPEAPGCQPGGTMADVACQGPYPQLNAADPFLGVTGGWLTGISDASLIALSADGRTVAFLGSPPGGSVDLFVADMRPERARRDAVRRLTEDLGGRNLIDIALAPDGRRVAFGTDRNAFALSPPFLVNAPPAVIGQPELWLIDLDGNTLQRLSRTVDGGPSGESTGVPSANPSPTSPSFDTTGRMVAWVSPASNLVPVDANGASDAFLVEDRTAPPGTPGRFDISTPPAVPTVPRAWKLALRAVAQRDGSVRFDATVPGAGVLRATVRATVPVTKRVKVKTRGGRYKTVRRRVLSRRQVAVASLVARSAGLSRLSVRVTKAYRSLVRAKAGLDATATVSFAAPSRATLRDGLAVRFRVISARKQTKTTTKGKAKR